MKCLNCNTDVNENEDICPKCSYALYDRYEADVEEYACLSISFEEINKIKKVLNSEKNFESFIKKLKSIITNEFKNTDLKVEFINNAYIIRFFKNLSFQSSVMNAVKHSVSLMAKFEQISYKLFKKKKTKFVCKMIITKRNILEELKPYSLITNIKQINKNSNEIKIKHADLQIITDQYVNKVLSRKYKQNIIYSTQFENNYIEYYEFPLYENIEISFDEEKNNTSNNLMQRNLPQIVEIDELNNREKQDLSLINVNSEFLNIKETDLPRIIQIALHNTCFISIKHPDNLPVLSRFIRNIVENCKMICVDIACLEQFKYEPYSLLKEILIALLGIDIYDVSKADENYQKLHTFDETDSLFRLFYGENNINISPEDSQKIYENVFQQIVENISNIVIFIENFDCCDEGTFELLKHYVDNYEDANISFIVTTSNNYSVHKFMPSLLYSNRYREITIQPSLFQDLFNLISEDCSEIIDSAYFNKIRILCRGNIFYFLNVFQYLTDIGVLVFNKSNRLVFNRTKFGIIPASVEQIVTKRFETLSQDEAYTLAYLILSGGHLSVNTLSALGINNLEEVLKLLEQKELICIRNELVVVDNIYILSKYIYPNLNNDIKRLLIDNLTKNNIKTVDFERTDLLKTYQLSEFSLSHGDFGVYLINCKKFLAELNNNTYISNDVKLLSRKIYSNLEKYINKFPSEMVYSTIKPLQQDAIKKQKSDKIIDLSSKILDSAILDKNYVLAEKSVRYIVNQILNIRMNNKTNEGLNFAYYYYQCLNVKILFYRGKYNECIKLVEKTLESLKNPVLMQKYKQNGLDGIFKIVLTYGAMAKILCCQNDLTNYFRKIVSLFSELEWFGSMLSLEMFLHTDNFNIDEQNIGIAKVINLFIKSFCNENFSYEQFAKDVHKAKIESKNINEIFWELLCDLLIGYSYQKLKSEKALYIYNDVKQISRKKGISFINTLSNLFIGNYKYENNEYNEAIQIFNNEAKKFNQTGSDNIILETLCNIFIFNTAIKDTDLGINTEHILYKINYAFNHHNLSKLGIFLINPEHVEEK